MTKLRQKRDELGLKQIDLSIQSGLQQSLVCRYERGQKPNQINAMKLANVLGCPVCELFPDFDKLRDY